jgi:hypothetical protein
LFLLTPPDRTTRSKTKLISEDLVEWTRTLTPTDPINQATEVVAFTFRQFLHGFLEEEKTKAAEEKEVPAEKMLRSIWMTF